MGTPNRLKYVLDGLTVAATELTAEERYAIIEHLLKLMRPQLKYLPEFQEFKLLMNFDYPSGAIIHRTDLAIVSWGSGGEIDSGTRVACVATPYYSSIGDTPLRRVTEKKLLITQTGKMYVWLEQYRIESSKEAAQKIIECQTAEFSQIVPLTTDDLVQILSPSVFEQFVASLREFVWKAGNQRRARLKSIEELSEKMAQVTARVDFRS